MYLLLQSTPSCKINGLRFCLGLFLLVCFWEHLQTTSISTWNPQGQWKTCQNIFNMKYWNYFTTKFYHSGQEDMQGFGTCYSPHPWHQAGTKRDIFLIASLGSNLWITPLLSSAGSQLTASKSKHTCVPALGDKAGTDKSQVTQKDWNSVSYSANLDEIWFVKLLFCISKFGKNICCKIVQE